MDFLRLLLWIWGALHNWEITDSRDLMPWPVWALHNWEPANKSKTIQATLSHPGSAVIFIQWSAHCSQSAACLCHCPKPWSHFCRKSLAKILFDLLWPLCHLLKIFHWGNYNLNGVLSSEYLNAGDPRDGELLFSKRQIRWGLQLHKPREMQVKALSCSHVNQFV